MWTLTLDTNSLISLEEGSGQAESVKRLVELHRDGIIRVFINGSSAGENLRGKIAPQHYDPFIERLDRLGLSNLPRIAPLARLGVSFFLGQSVLASDGDSELEQKIMSVLSADGPKSFADYLTNEGLPLDSPVTPRWRNLYSDVDAIMGHIRNRNHIFVTEDLHFLRLDRRTKLIQLGAGEILTPDDTLITVKTKTPPVTIEI